MNGSSIFAAPARRLFFAAGDPAIAGGREGVASWMKRFDGGGFITADIERRGIDRFLRCRTEWHRENSVPATLFDPVKNDQLGTALRKEFRIDTRATDFSLKDQK